MRSNASTYTPIDTESRPNVSTYQERHKTSNASGNNGGLSPRDEDYVFADTDQGANQQSSEDVKNDFEASLAGENLAFI